jgi:hypothetical protein
MASPRTKFALACLIILDVMYRLLVQLQLLVYIYCRTFRWRSIETSVNKVSCGSRRWQYVWFLPYSDSAGKGRPIFNITGTHCRCYKFKTLIGSILSDSVINL